jgi:hypothetical protein
VVLDRARADEQPGGDLLIREAVIGEPGDLHLLRGELAARPDGAFAHRLAGGLQLSTGPLGEPLHAHRAVQLLGDAQLLAGVPAPTLAAQPFAVEQMGAGERHTDVGAAEPLDRFAIQLFGGRAVAQQRSRARLDPQRPVRASGAADLLEPQEVPAARSGSPLRTTASMTSVGTQVDNPSSCGSSAACSAAARNSPSIPSRTMTGQRRHEGRQGEVVGDWCVSLVPDRKHHGRPSFRGSGVGAAQLAATAAGHPERLATLDGHTVRWPATRPPPWRRSPSRRAGGLSGHDWPVALATGGCEPRPARTTIGGPAWKC